MSAKMLEVSLLGPGTVIRLKRDAWSLVWPIDEGKQQISTPPHPPACIIIPLVAFAANSFRSYYLSGFLTLQTTLDRFMFKRALPGDQSQEGSEDGSEDEFACVPPNVIGVPFPTAAYNQNLFYAAVGYLLGLAMTMVRRLTGGLLL